MSGHLAVTIPDDLPALHVDQIFLSQALTNVLDNAVTHSASGADIAVSATAIGDEVEIRVEDSAPGRLGGGPAAALRSLLSGAGRRGSVTPRRRPGADRRARVDRGDGRDGAGLRERPGRARDHDPCAGRTSRTRGGVMPSADGPEVLLIEDDEPTRRMVAANLGARGYRVDGGARRRVRPSSMGAAAARSRDRRPRPARDQRPRGDPSDPDRWSDPDPRPLGP